MEKLLSSIVIICLFFISKTSLAQDSYCVFNVKGEPVTAKGMILKKGDIIAPEDSFKVKESEQVLLVDEKGTLFEIPQNNDCSFETVANFKKDVSTASFSKKYLTYVWQKFSKQKTKGANLGVVYRNDKTYLQLTPRDSVKVFVPELEFSWVTEHPDDKSYFLLREKGGAHETKFGIIGNQLHLFVDYEILKPGKTYEWGVSREKFPDTEAMELFTFELLTSDQFNAYTNDINQLKADMKLLGFNDTEIKNMLCEDYKLCY